MKTTSEFLLSFMLNGFWQIALIAAAAAFGDWLLRRAAVRYRHTLWVAALTLSFALPLISSARFDRSGAASVLPEQSIAVQPVVVTEVPASISPQATTDVKPALSVSQRLAVGLLGLYVLFLLYRCVRLFRAWFRAKAVSRGATPIEATDRIRAVVARCQQAVGTTNVGIVSSNSLRAPATVGIRRPLIILPEKLVRDASDDELIAAIGHELVHVRRRDYLLNLIYEIVFLPLSFHPAATLMRRRITQTRELRCDELVAELLLQPEVYARSLVQLAGSAMPFARRARTVTVGIADADILEVRIMSLLKRTKLSPRSRRIWLVAAALLLAIPCVAAGAFALHLNIDGARAQEPSREAQEKNELRSRREQEIKEKMQREVQQIEERIKTETNEEVKAKLERRLVEMKAQIDKPIGVAVTSEGNNFMWVGADEARAREEREQERRRQAQLAQLARITMDQAIQIATSQTPGKVFECSLVGEHWEGPEQLAKPSLVLYHVVILSGDDAKPTTTHVLVNAQDGTIFRSSKEELRKEEGGERRKIESEERPREPFSTQSGERRLLNGGVLNRAANNLPAPEYPAIAKAAHASGAVNVEVMIDENGSVVAARAVDGHPLLQAAAVNAARQASFAPTRLKGEPVKVTGVLVYKFEAQ